MKESIRKQYEEAILAACLTENAYPKICHILKAKNFIFQGLGGIEYSQIYECMGRVSEHTPIDLLTMHMAMYRLHGEQADLPACLGYLATRRTTGSNVVAYAFELLRMDFTAKFRAAMLSRRTDQLAADNQLAAQDITEVIEAIDNLDRKLDATGLSILTVIEEAANYFLKKRLDEEHSICQDFLEALSERMHQVKQLRQINFHASALMLAAESNTNPVVRSHSTELVYQLISLITTGKPV